MFLNASRTNQAPSSESVPPSTSSLSRTVSAAATEYDRLLFAVSQIEPTYAQEISEMILSLKRKERALCLFNADFLQEKVAEARTVLLSLEEDGNEEDEEDDLIAGPYPSPGKKLQPPSFATPLRTQSAPTDTTYPFQPVRLADDSVMSASSPVSPATPPATVITVLTESKEGERKTLKELGQMSAKDGLGWLEGKGEGQLPVGLVAPDPSKKREMEMFLNGLVVGS